MAIAAGAGRMPFGPYMVASVVTNGLYAGALAGNGAALLPDALAGPGLVFPLLLPVVGWLVWRWHARRAKARGG